MSPDALLLQAAAKQGFAARISAVGRIDEAMADLEKARQGAPIDPTLWQEWLSTVGEPLPKEFHARSLILFAIPSSEVRISFQHGRRVELIMPPTYAEYPTLPVAIARWAASQLQPLGYRVKPAGRIPLKTLAVRSGLGEYGRNNLCYVPGMGSWGHLVALYSDLEPSCESWGEPKVLDRCISCRACVKSCPAEAISTERFVVHAERCITFHTERAAEIPLPDWGSKRPPCIFGCMECQKKCPENRSVQLRAEAGAAFDELETEQLLAGAALDTLGEGTVRKLRTLDWVGPYYDQLSRNLQGLLT